MKTIIDEKTGEVIEVEDTNEIMVRELYELGTNLEVYDKLEEQADTIKEQIEIWKYQNRENIKQILKKHNQKNIKTSSRTYSIVDEGTRKVIDTDRLMQEGLYLKYIKLVPVGEHLKVNRRKNK